MCMKTKLTSGQQCRHGIATIKNDWVHEIIISWPSTIDFLLNAHHELDEGNLNLLNVKKVHILRDL